MDKNFILNKPLNHLAIIMDGNGRWAKEKGKPRTYGHKMALEQLILIVKECSRLGIKATSLYAFSTENWNRPKDEISQLFNYLEIFFKREMKTLLENNVKIHISGDISKLPISTQKACLSAIEKSKDKTGMVLNICLNYGGHDEILRATNNLINDAKNNKISLPVTKELFESYLYTAYIAPVDLLIRTSGEMRTSNFLPWQLTYAEMVFPLEKFPEFDVDCLHRCIREYESRKRRYGGITDEK